MTKATVVYIQIPVSSLGDVIEAVRAQADLARRGAAYEYGTGNVRIGSNLVNKSYKMRKIAEAMERKLNRVTIRNDRG